jgi:hypothetical protein
MSSGAYALFLDQPAGAGPDATIQRVIPLVPVSHQGAISFNHGWLSVAYDNFGTVAPVEVRVRVLNPTFPESIRLDETLFVPMGRTVITEIMQEDRAASLTVTTSPPHPALAALVEFDD